MLLLLPPGRDLLQDLDQVCDSISFFFLPSSILLFLFFFLLTLSLSVFPFTTEKSLIANEGSIPCTPPHYDLDTLSSSSSAGSFRSPRLNLLHEISLIFQEKSSLLTKSLLSTLISLTPIPDHLETYIVLVLELHRASDDLFFLLFREELRGVREVTVVLRQNSISVFVLRHLLRPFRSRVEMMAEKLITFARGKKAQIILVDSDEFKKNPKFGRVKQKLLKAVEHFLQAEVLPLGLCVLCYELVEAVRHTKHIKRVDGTPLSRWVVGAVIFLRLLIPILTSYSFPTSQEERGKGKKGFTLMGRFLMKLSCKSSFSQAPGCLANEVLDETFGLFDGFCEDVIQIGREGSQASTKVREQRLVAEAELSLSSTDMWRISLCDLIGLIGPQMLGVIQSEAVEERVASLKLLQRLHSLLQKTNFLRSYIGLSPDDISRRLSISPQAFSPPAFSPQPFSPTFSNPK